MMDLLITVFNYPNPKTLLYFFELKSGKCFIGKDITKKFKASLCILKYANLVYEDFYDKKALFSHRRL